MKLLRSSLPLISLVSVGFEGLRTAHADRVTQDHAIERGTAYLLASQKKDGSFGVPVLAGDVGVTGLCVRALCEAPVQSDHALAEGRDAAVAKAVRWLRAQQRIDGAFDPAHAGHAIYATAHAVQGLAASRIDAARSEVRRGRHFLEETQGAKGGWGYEKGPKSPPQVLVTASVLEALRASGVPAIAPVTSRSLRFLAAAQRSDGGFGEDATPSDTLTTCAGLHALALAGVPRSDPRVRRAIAWLASRTPLDQPESAGFFFSCCHLARALAVLGLEDLPTMTNARDRIVGVIAERQQEDGSWANNVRGYAEYVPDVGTGLALGACRTKARRPLLALSDR